MALTYEPIATLSGLGTFSSIPQTYTDLKLVGVTASGAQNIEFRYNNDASNIYSNRFMGTDGVTNRANSTNGNRNYPSFNFATGFGFYEIDIFGYTGSLFKTSLARFFNDNNSNGEVAFSVGNWRSTAAITSITLLNNGGNPLTLYGIKAA
jgi:hypothetical protein